MAVEPPLVAASGWEMLEPLIRDRRAAGVTQTEMAVVLGIDRATLNRRERGSSTIPGQFCRQYRAKLDHLIALRAKRAAKSR